MPIRKEDIRNTEIGRVSVANSAGLLRILAEFSKRASSVFMKLHNSTVSLDHRIIKLHEIFTKVRGQLQPANSVASDPYEANYCIHETEVVVNWGIKLTEVVYRQFSFNCDVCRSDFAADL
jgi:hypothetical protein